MVTKPDYSALLKPGLHQLTVQDLFDLAVAPFPNDGQRALLFSKFSVWQTQIQQIGLKGVIWIDGSFLTEKPGPSDIDCVFWKPYWSNPINATDASRELVKRLFDHATARTLFGLDFYYELPDPSDLIHREAYWKGFFGYCHDRVTAKGFAEIHL